MQYILLIIGFVLLIKGADVFVDGAASIASKFNVPSMIIGLTIVAMGTSAPEAAISITSSLAGQNDMSIANVIGSNIFNILVVLGTSAIIAKLPVEKNTIKRDIPFLLGISILLLLFGRDSLISRIEGLTFLVLFVYFLINTIKDAKNNETKEATTIESPILKSILLSIIGLIGIIIGGDITVDAAVNIATTLGMSANLIGLTIIAIGTSLPELVTSFVAAKKGETEIAIGNAIGSSIFNILLILGLASTIVPLTISLLSLIDIIFMLITIVLLYLIIKNNSCITKKYGCFFILIYIGYMVYIIMR